MMETAHPDTLLSVENVIRHFGGIKAVDGCSLEVARGSITGLIGPNGAGKTTLFRCITGFEHLDSGTVRFKGENITGLPPNRIFLKGMTRSFQITKQLNNMTVLENVLLAAGNEAGESVWNNLWNRR